MKEGSALHALLYPESYAQFRKDRAERGYVIDLTKTLAEGEDPYLDVVVEFVDLTSEEEEEE